MKKLMVIGVVLTAGCGLLEQPEACRFDELAKIEAYCAARYAAANTPQEFDAIDAECEQLEADWEACK